MEIRFELKSITGMVLKVYDDRVVLSQEGVMGTLTRGLSGDKTFYYCDITSVQFKEAGWTAGFIEFTFPGSNDLPGGSILGSTNENRYTFSKPTLGAARALNIEAIKAKDFIEEKIKEYKENKNRKANNEYISVADEIKKFKSLLDEGIITQEEFDEKKRKLLEL